MTLDHRQNIFGNDAKGLERAVAETIRTDTEAQPPPGRPQARPFWLDLTKQVAAAGIIASVVPSLVLAVLELFPGSFSAAAAWVTAPASGHLSLAWATGNDVSWLTSVKATLSVTVAAAVAVTMLGRRYRAH